MVILSFSTVLWANSDYGVGIDPTVLMMEHPDAMRHKKPDEVIDAFQSTFIKSMYLRPIFTKSYAEEDEEYADLSGGGIYDEIMMQAFADDLARQDMLKLKKLITQGVYGTSKTNSH